MDLKLVNGLKVVWQKFKVDFSRSTCSVTRGLRENTDSFALWGKHWNQKAPKSRKS